MSIDSISLDKAELLSVILEGLLYGFSFLMFGGTIWILLSRRSIQQVNLKMVAVACFLLLFSTLHFMIDIIRIMQGLILFRDTFSGGPVGYFSDMSQWTSVSKNYIYTIQTLIGDGVVLYRCYAVWQSKAVMILPALLRCAVCVTGIGSSYAASRTRRNEVFDGTLSQWITSFYASTLLTNLLTTILLAYRIWYVDRESTKLLGGQKSHLRPMLLVVIDAGVIYYFTLFSALMCFVNHSNGQYVILDMITPIISITFYMVIIRVGLANQGHQAYQQTTALLLEQRYSDTSAEQRRRTQVHDTPVVDDGGCENGDQIQTERKEVV